MAKITKYCCGTCNEVWSEEFQADDCCFNPTYPVEWFTCDNCGEEYENKKEAFECCEQTKLNVID
jgi:hypothetical protein